MHLAFGASRTLQSRTKRLRHVHEFVAALHPGLAQATLLSRPPRIANPAVLSTLLPPRQGSDTRLSSSIISRNRTDPSKSPRLALDDQQQLTSGGLALVMMADQTPSRVLGTASDQGAESRLTSKACRPDPTMVFWKLGSSSRAIWVQNCGWLKATASHLLNPPFSCCRIAIPSGRLGVAVLTATKPLRWQTRFGPCTTGDDDVESRCASCASSL